LSVLAANERESAIQNRAIRHTIQNAAEGSEVFSHLNQPGALRARQTLDQGIFSLCTQGKLP
jgi:hypothetical protein